MKDEEIETLDFEESPTEEIEMLDFEADKKVSEQIDEMLQFIDVSSKEKTNIELDVNKEKLDEYKPSIKDFNIKSAKTRKIVKKSMLYIIILMLIGFEFFVNKAGEALNNIKVYASNNEPIKIVQNEKYGYIDSYGNKIVNPKYIYGEDFNSGYAIVKNTSNMPLIIDKGGKEVVKSGTYFSIYRAKDDIIASKVTKKGLKYGILSSSLKTKTDFIYDSISYKDGVYTFVYGNFVGLINEEGKQIYEYKLTDKDDKKIEVIPCPVTNDKYERYGVVTINGTSLIINLKDGNKVSSPTLNKITPEENNVFYEIRDGGIKKYIYVQNNKVLLESENYSSLSIEKIETGVLKAINTSYNYEFISTKNLEQFEKGLSVDNVYYGDNVVMYKSHDYKKRTDVISFVKNGEVYKKIPLEYEIYKPYKNGIAIAKFNDGTYGYMNEDGDFINDERYIEAYEFDSYGDAIAKTNNGYGVLKKNGKVLISFNNEEIKMSPDFVKMNYAKAKAFYAVKNAGLYTLYNKNGKKIGKTLYESIEFDDKYPVLKASTEAKDLILTLIDMKEISITSTNIKYEAHNNYLIVKNEYYNYDGKLIYVDNKES